MQKMMQSKTRNAALAVVAMLSILGALFVFPSPAHASTLTVTVEDGSAISLGAIDVVLATDCDDVISDVPPLKVTPWDCDDWDVTGGFIDSVDVEAESLWVVDGVAAMIDDDITVDMTDDTFGSCTVTISGSRLLTYDSMSGLYELGDEVGEYSLSACSMFLTGAITTVLGASPSAQPMDIAFDITLT